MKERFVSDVTLPCDQRRTAIIRPRKLGCTGAGMGWEDGEERSKKDKKLQGLVFWVAADKKEKLFFKENDKVKQ